MRRVDHHLALCGVDDRDVADKVARAAPVRNDTPDNYVNAHHRRREVVRQPALISKLKTWCCIALLSCCSIAMRAPWDKAAACLGPASERRPFFDELPSHFDEPVAAQITVTALLDSQISARLLGKASFNVLARVDRMLKGSLDVQTIKIIAPASSCDYPFIVGSSGIVIGKPIMTGGGMTELHITAQWIAERWERQRRREQGNPR